MASDGGVQIGDTMPDGTKYAGMSSDTGRPMYAAPADAPLTYTFNQAPKYAAGLDAHGHQDWRAPTKSELNVLYNNRAAIGGFNESRSDRAAWYWSAWPTSRNNAWDQHFGGGNQTDGSKTNEFSLRCVRG